MTMTIARSLRTTSCWPAWRSFWYCFPPGQTLPPGHGNKRLQSTLPASPHDATLTQKSPTTLQWVHAHEKSPVEFGFLNVHGFQPFIPVNTALPVRKKLRLACLFDYIDACDFELAYRPSPRDIYISLCSTRLSRIRKGKGVDMQWYGLFEMDNSKLGKDMMI